jgi:hypothetical protein
VPKVTDLLAASYRLLSQSDPDLSRRTDAPSPTLMDADPIPPLPNVADVGKVTGTLLNPFSNQQCDAACVGDRLAESRETCVRIT